MRRPVSRHRHRLRAALVVSALAAMAHPGDTRADHSASAGVYVRDDTNRTLVISPRLRLRTALASETHLDLAYAVDVWTSASVDIVASASQPVTEQRDELNVGVDQVLGDLTLEGGYRASIEPDYESHGGSASVSLNLADNAATLAWMGAASFDQVGRAGDEDFNEAVDTFVTGLSFTQVLDPAMLVQLLYDLSVIRGYQASAYRYVAIGIDGACYGVSAFCLPERNPRQRLRHALALRLRRAFGRHWSIGAGYRAYLDDWGIVSHTAKGDVAWAPDAHSALVLSYRFYTQSAADHYQPFYFTETPYYTRDRELSTLSSHRVALELDRVWSLPGGDSGLLTGLEIAPSFFFYQDFPLLERVSAIEVTAVLGMEFP